MAFGRRAMEGLGMIQSEFWHGKRVLLTGHTGFKGAWLSYVLKLLGAKVYGYSLKPKSRYSFFELLIMNKGYFEKNIYANILKLI